MNAPASPQNIRPGPRAAGPDLLAWPLMGTVIGFGTTSRDSNLAVIDWVRDFVAGHGIDICGAGHIAQAHQPNEWVTADPLARCEAFMRRLADRVCAV
jgi:acetylornithine deacetylase/succinyl-diaminopimelate desuccinylase-like protein